MLNTLWVIMCYSGRKEKGMQKLAEQHKKKMLQLKAALVFC